MSVTKVPNELLSDPHIGVGITDTATSAKLAVSNTGIDVTGSVTASSLDVSGSLQVDSGTSSNIIIEKNNTGGAALRFHNEGLQKSYIQLDASEDMIHYGASGVNQIVYAGGSERMRISSVGRVTMPDQPSFMARGFSQRLSAYNSVQFYTVHHNIGNHYDNATGIFTAPTAGRYFISWIANIKASSSYMGWDLMVNGTAFLQSYSDIGTLNYDMVGGTVVLDLAASDNLRVYNTPSYAAPSTSITYSHFSVHLLG